jgi:hypothetical protein
MQQAERKLLKRTKTKAPDSQRHKKRRRLAQRKELQLKRKRQER